MPDVQDRGVVVGVDRHVGQGDGRIGGPGSTTSGHWATGAAVGRARPVWGAHGEGRNPSRSHVARLRSIRSASAISTDAPQSDRAKSISSAVHQALKLTEIAPTDTAAAKDTTHSG